MRKLKHKPIRIYPRVKFPGSVNQGYEVVAVGDKEDCLFNDSRYDACKVCPGELDIRGVIDGAKFFDQCPGLYNRENGTPYLVIHSSKEGVLQEQLDTTPEDGHEGLEPTE